MLVNEAPKINPEINSAELQQILETAEHTTIVGTRIEWGDVHYQNIESSSDPTAESLFPGYPDTILTQDFTANFYHYTAYGYHTWQIADPFALTAGLAYDWLQQPTDVATAPFATELIETRIIE
jgi:outer membrane receptor protein involved in Fe transport